MNFREEIFDESGDRNDVGSFDRSEVLPTIYDKNYAQKRGRRRGSITGGEVQSIYSGDTWKRRQAVASLRARGLTAEEIQEELTSINLVNPTTNEPWSISVIKNDFSALVHVWKEAANISTSQHINRLLAELLEVKRAAWRLMDLQTVLLAIDREAKLLGLYAPTQHQIILDERIKELADVLGLDAGVLKHTAEAIAEGRTP